MNSGIYSALLMSYGESQIKKNPQNKHIANKETNNETNKKDGQNGKNSPWESFRLPIAADWYFVFVLFYFIFIIIIIFCNKIANLILINRRGVAFVSLEPQRNVLATISIG